MADKLQLEETNRLRISLGMAPLPGPSSSSSSLSFKKSTTDDPQGSDEEEASTLDTRHAAAGSNWEKLQKEQQAKKRAEEKRQKLKKDRDAAQRYAKLEGKGLADDDEGEDTSSWLAGIGKRQKKIELQRAKQLQEELEERERMAQSAYTEKDLAGARVGHELGDFEVGTEQILTLKDADVEAGSDEEDELENVQLREAERRKERLELKKKKPDYDPNDEESGGFLSKYDEEIGGKKKKNFTLTGEGQAAGYQSLADADESVPGRTRISLDFLNEKKPETSDYQEAKEVKIKKPKKKKDKTKRRKPTDDDDDVFPHSNGAGSAPPDSMDIDEGKTTSSIAPKRKAEESFVDDDDLQSHLTQQRQAALKKRKRMRPEDLARQLREAEEDQATNAMDTAAPEEEGGLVFDETSRFVDTLEKPEAPSKPARPTSSSTKPTNGTHTGNPTSDAEDEQMPDVKASSASPPPINQPPAESSTGLESEANLTQGMGATLNMLTSRGIIKTAASGDLNAQFRERQRFLAEKQKREAAADARARAQRERDRVSGRLDRMSVREREQYAAQQNNMRDQQDSRQAAEVFNREYKPNVELKYVDEFGRNMSEKEAFKHLSHQFHGKGSGKTKTEKLLKRVEEEKKEKGKTLLDVGAKEEGLERGMRQQARKKGQAGVRLQ